MKQKSDAAQAGQSRDSGRCELQNASDDPAHAARIGEGRERKEPSRSPHRLSLFLVQPHPSCERMKANEPTQQSYSSLEMPAVREGGREGGMSAGGRFGVRAVDPVSPSEGAAQPDASNSPSLLPKCVMCGVDWSVDDSSGS